QRTRRWRRPTSAPCFALPRRHGGSEDRGQDQSTIGSLREVPMVVALPGDAHPPGFSPPGVFPVRDAKLPARTEPPEPPPSLAVRRLLATPGRRPRGRGVPLRAAAQRPKAV